MKLDHLRTAMSRIEVVAVMARSTHLRRPADVFRAAGSAHSRAAAGPRAGRMLSLLAWLVAELANVRESIASTTWSRGCLASMGIAPNARKRSCVSRQPAA